jgi:hypothetical protein
MAAAAKDRLAKEAGQVGHNLEPPPEPGEVELVELRNQLILKLQDSTQP